MCYFSTFTGQFSVILHNYIVPIAVFLCYNHMAFIRKPDFFRCELQSLKVIAVNFMFYFSDAKEDLLNKFPCLRPKPKYCSPVPPHQSNSHNDMKEEFDIAKAKRNFNDNDWNDKAFRNFASGEYEHGSTGMTMVKGGFYFSCEKPGQNRQVHGIKLILNDQEVEIILGKPGFDAMVEKYVQLLSKVKPKVETFDPKIARIMFQTQESSDQFRIQEETSNIHPMKMIKKRRSQSDIWRKRLERQRKMTEDSAFVKEDIDLEMIEDEVFVEGDIDPKKKEKGQGKSSKSNFT